MTVGELIVALQQLDRNLPVVVEQDLNGDLYDVTCIEPVFIVPYAYGNQHMRVGCREDEEGVVDAALLR